MIRKKILILTSSGGAGHMSATHAIQEYVGADYDIIVAHAFGTIFKKFDVTRYLLPHSKNCEDLYNWLLNNRWYWAINWYYRFGQWYFKMRPKKLTTTMQAYIAAQKPDLVISLIPFVNGITLQACQNLSLPFIVIPTDLDVKTFTVGIQNPTYEKFLFARAFDEPLSYATLQPAHIAHPRTPIVGFPLRSNFFESHTTDEAKNKWQLPTNKPLIMLMMGGQGALIIIDYARALASLAIPVHLIICIGKFERMRTQLKDVAFPAHISYSVVGYTDKIAQIMSVAHLIITKSGSVSFCESIYSEKPILLDATGPILKWEQLNHTLVKERGFGQQVTDLHQLPSQVEEILSSPNIYNLYRDNLNAYPKKRPDIEIPKMIKQVI